MGSRSELPGNDQRSISFKSVGFEATVRIDLPGMDKLTPSQRESMKVTIQMFTAALSQAIDPINLQEAGATTSDVLRHLRYRIGQVPSSLVDGSITQDPAKTSPSPATAMRAYAHELGAASIKS